MGEKKKAYINHEMLIWARSNTPFESTIDVQKRLKIDASKIDKWENGEEYPSITDAKKLASLYKMPFAAFYLTDIPGKEPHPYTDRRTCNDTIYKETSYALWSEVERIIGNRDEMLQFTEDEESFNYESVPTINQNCSISKIAEVIGKYLEINPPFKNKTAYGGNSFKYYRSVLESKGIFVAQVTGVSLEEMKGLSVFYEKFPIIAVNNKDYDRSKTFSIMHEMAHLVRRSSSLCLIDFDERNDEEEKLCDSIAAEVLMPEKAFASIVNKYHVTDGWDEECLKSIADKFGVSVFSVIRRLPEVGFISRNEYFHLYGEYSDAFEKKQKEIDANKESKNNYIPYYAKYLNKEGYLYTKTIMSAYSRGTITYGELCNVLNVSSLHIGKMERAVMFV